MTPTQIILAARRAYNAEGDTFWSDSELLDYIHFAQLDFSQQALPIERTFTTTTVAGTQEYDFPTNVIQIKRITYDGEKLSPISLDEDDLLTANNANTTDRGRPLYYMQWDESILLRPIPDAAEELKVYGYVEPQAVTLTSTLEVPSVWHPALFHYVVYSMALKDQNAAVAKAQKDNYDMYVLKGKKFWSKKRRGDRYAVVKNEDVYSNTFLGVV